MTTPAFRVVKPVKTNGAMGMIRTLVTWVKDNRENLYPTVKLALLIILGFLFLHGLPILLKTSGETGFTKEVEGWILKITPIENLVQTYEGHKLAVTGYDFEYRYEVEGRVYKGRYLLPVKSLEMAESGRIKLLKTGDKIHVRYKADDVNESIIEFE